MEKYLQFRKSTNRRNNLVGFSTQSNAERIKDEEEVCLGIFEDGQITKTKIIK